MLILPSVSTAAVWELVSYRNVQPQCQWTWQLYSEVAADRRRRLTTIIQGMQKWHTMAKGGDSRDNSDQLSSTSCAQKRERVMFLWKRKSFIREFPKLFLSRERPHESPSFAIVNHFCNNLYLRTKAISIHTSQLPAPYPNMSYLRPVVHTQCQ